MNTTLTLSAAPAYQPANLFASIQSFIHSVLSLFAAQDDPAALSYMLRKNGETVD